MSKSASNKSECSIDSEIVGSKTSTSQLDDLLLDISLIKKKLTQNNLDDESHLADIIMHMVATRLKIRTNIN